ncbi:MAG: hypothetical protein ABJC12_10720 [Saprospiraceae bacterium]
MKLFSLNFTTLILRFYLLMAIVIGSFFAGLPWLAILSLPVFMSSMMGMSFSKIRFSFRTRNAEKRDYAGLHQTAHS